MIDANEIRTHAADWGTAEAQIRKDHLISHLLNSLEGLKGFVFFGGTALNRTVLASERLSEDIDLYLDPNAPADIDAVLDALRTGTSSEFPDLRISREGVRGDVETFSITTEDLVVQLQVVEPRHELGRYETEVGDVALRYSDLPETVPLRVPTADTFVAMKCVAFEDRQVPRDLHDLGSLALAGAIRPSSVEALHTFRGFGPVQALYAWDRSPTPEVWRTELAHQLRDPGSPDEALGAVRKALAQASGWKD